MTNESPREPQGGSQPAGTNHSNVVQIHLEEVGRHSWKDALMSAVVGAGSGPLYHFVAAAPSAPHTGAEHAAVGAEFSAHAIPGPDGSALISRCPRGPTR